MIFNTKEMVTKNEILNVKDLCGLNPHIIEKDYVLGWVLAGIYHHASLKNHWIFKGGTSFHKCHYETFRFSEDLDFTITEPSHLNCDFLVETFSEISDWIFYATGFEIPKRLLNFEIYTNPRGSKSCKAKIGYRGPISPRMGYRSLPRLKIDLTFDEVVVLPPVGRTIHHHYSDNPQEEPLVRCYPPEEAYAEKICALGQRAKARDLYDAINIFRSNQERPDLSVLNDTIRKKCAHRGNQPPALADVQAKRWDLEKTWPPMLSHQLQTLPPFESFFHALPEFFDWLETGTLPSLPAIDQMAAGDEIIREPTLNLPVNFNKQVFTEAIRFSGVNYLCADIQYRKSTERIEPYSLRRTKDGHLVLHAVRASDGQLCSYQVDEIDDVTVTQQSFDPRYLVELRPRIQPS